MCTLAKLINKQRTLLDEILNFHEMNQCSLYCDDKKMKRILNSLLS